MIKYCKKESFLFQYVVNISRAFMKFTDADGLLGMKISACMSMSVYIYMCVCVCVRERERERRRERLKISEISTTLTYRVFIHTSFLLLSNSPFSFFLSFFLSSHFFFFPSLIFFSFLVLCFCAFIDVSIYHIYLCM